MLKKFEKSVFKIIRMYRRHPVGSRESILLSQIFVRNLLFADFKWGQDVPMTASWKLAIRFYFSLILKYNNSFGFISTSCLPYFVVMIYLPGIKHVAA